MKTIQDFIDNTNQDQQISESAIYEDIIYRLEDAKENGTPVDEGLFGAIFGGLAGATAGPAVMKAVCKVLGIDEKGSMGNLMTSRMVLTAMGAYLGWKR